MDDIYCNLDFSFSRNNARKAMIGPTIIIAITTYDEFQKNVVTAPKFPALNKTKIPPIKSITSVAANNLT